MKVSDLKQFFSDIEGLEPIVEAIEAISSIPEENLNETTTQVYQGMIEGAFTPEIKNKAVEDMIKGFKVNNLSKEEITKQIQELKDSIKLVLQEIEISENKKNILSSLFYEFVSLTEEAYKGYLVYDIKLPIKVDSEDLIPTYAHETDAAADIYAAEDITIPANSISNLIKTGLRIQLPRNWAAIVVPRSSIGMKTGLRLSNSQGIIDSDYRGEIGVIYDNISDSDYTIKRGDRIAQMYIMPIYHFKAQVVDVLEETERGEGGYGSTGK